MAISNDSFGSPGLGEGIGLQGTLKDYTPLIAKSRLAEQAMASKAAQKKLDAELEDQAELDEALSKFKPDGTGLKAFDPQRQKIAKEYFDTIRDLKQKGKSVKGSVEYREAEWKAQNEFNKLKFLEDRYKKELDFIATHKNDNRFQANERRLQALENPDEYLLLSGGDIYNNIGPLFEELPQYNIMKDMADMQKTVKPEVIGKTYLTTLSDGTQTIAYDETSEFDQGKIDQAWNRFKTFDSVQAEAKKLVDRNFYPDMNSALSALESDFKRPFENSRKIKAKQKFEKDTALSGAGGGLGTTDWNFQSQKDDNDSKNLTAVVNNEQLATFINQPNTKNILDFIEKYQTSTSSRRIIDRSDISQVDKAIKDFESLIDNDNKDALSLAKQMYGSGFTKDIPISKAPPRVALKGKSEELYFSPRGKESKTFSVISYNGEKLDNAVILSYGRVVDSTGKSHKFFKVKVPNKRGGEEMYVPADESSYGKENRNTIGTPIGVSADRFDEALDKYYTAGTKPTKFENGGEIQPKEISKKFHDKSRNMTKFVYSDGSEEIFKGLL